MTNKQIARHLQDTAALIELTGGNPFRARAFSNAGRTIERLEKPVSELIENGTLTDLQGVGAGLAAQIQELLETGSFELRDELLSALPPGLLDLLDVKGLGPKKIRRLWKELGITSLEALEAAATAGRLADLEGFGAKSQEKILANVRLLRTYQTRQRCADALQTTQPMLDRLRRVAGVERVAVAGDLQRRMETVENVLLVVAAADPAETMPALVQELDGTVSEAGSRELRGTLPDGLPLRLVVVDPDRFGTILWRHTGSETHVRQFEARYGAPDDYPREEDVYDRAGLPSIPPELREGAGELDAAEAGALPRLVTFEDLHGLLHNHSTYSDGAHSLREMAEHTRQMGFSYFGICDHSQSLKIANGLSVDEVRRQQEEIERLNALFAQDGGPPFRIFSGIESDILPDGSLDYPDDVLATFDFVVASVHTRFNMTRQEATERLIKAVENPYTTILGHPTGRLLLVREGYPIDHEAVIEACARNEVAIELNANPYRLDLDWRWVREATRRGVLISINPDAHAMDQLGYVRWGLAVARKGWLTPEQCLNAKPLKVFAAWLTERRSARVSQDQPPAS